MGGRSDELASSRKRQGLLDELVSFRKRNGADQSLVSLCISRCVRAMRMTCGCHVAHVQCYHGAQECQQGTHWRSEGCRRIALRARVLHGWCRGSSSGTKLCTLSVGGTVADTLGGGYFLSRGIRIRVCFWRGVCFLLRICPHHIASYACHNKKHQCGK